MTITLSYLLGAYLAKTNQQTLVICTATTTLQAQLLRKDLPILEKFCDRNIKVVLAKGRQNYVCKHRLYHPEHYEDVSVTPSVLDQLRGQLESNRWDGDRERLPLGLSKRDWSGLTMDHHGCLGKQCEYFQSCSYFKARRSMQQAEIVVANHDLLLTDLQLGGGVILPKPETSIYIFDECHHLPNKALNQFTCQSGVLSACQWLETSIKAFEKASNIIDRSQDVVHLKTLTQSLIENLQDFHACIQSHWPENTASRWHLETLPQKMVDGADVIHDLAYQWHQGCAKFWDEIHKQLEFDAALQNNQAASGLLAQLGFLKSRGQNLKDTWALLKRSEVKQVPIARWIERKPLNRSQSTLEVGEDFQCHCVPVSAAPMLKQKLWEGVHHSAILCSATLKALDSFDTYLKEVGLEGDSRLTTSTLPSPFPYEKSYLFVPQMRTVPQAQNIYHHLQESIELLQELLALKSANLILFTSRQAMHEVYRALKPQWGEALMHQDENSKSVLLRTHYQRIDDDQSSCLMGLASLAEGLDLPGLYCEHVIIHKLPFAVPTHPIEVTRAKWLQRQNRDPFIEYTLPKTAIKLKQSVGRLIRQQSDRGIVTILDSRLYRKRYGSGLIASLPGFTTCVNQTMAGIKRALAL